MLKILIFLLIIASSVQGFAQNSMITNINITLPASPDPSTANWGSGTSVFLISASSKATNGRVDGSVIESKLLVIIKKGGSKVCGSYTSNTAPAADFNAMTKVWSGSNAVSYLGKDCLLASGDYELCVQFFGYGSTGSIPLSDEKCKPFSIKAVEQQTYQPPQPISPADGTEVSESAIHQPIIFRWIPVVPRPQEPVTYRLKVWQLMQGQTGVQAMNANQPIQIKDVDNITQTVVADLLNGSSCKLPYLCSFIWNVQALSKDERPFGENKGISRPFVFSASTVCDCGKWMDPVVKIQGKPDTTTTRVKCNESVALPKGNYTIQIPGFICNQSIRECDVTYLWSVEGTVSGQGTGQNFSFDFSEPGNYNIVFTPVCGGNKCQTCNVVIVILKTLSLPDDTKDILDCKNYGVELRKIYRGDSIAYNCTITNKNTDAATNPKSFRIKIRKDSVITIRGSIPKEWSRTPSKFPPGSTTVNWTRNSGTIANGEYNLGTIYFSVPVLSPFYVACEWLSKEGRVVCKDSVKLTDTRFYYELEKEPSGIYTEIANDILRIQFFNQYAAIENLSISIYDVGIRKIKRKSGGVIKLYSVNGLNRISIDIKDYNLEPGRPYLLRVSDYYSHYHLNFKVTNDREK